MSDPPAYEVIDGQQRVRSIFDFASGKLAVSTASLGRSTSGGTIKRATLTASEESDFLNFQITVSIISNASSTFKRTLFARLQLGERLNPAELRNALPSAVPREIRSIALTHRFFEVAGIKDSRYRRDDYLTHTFALLEHSSEKTWKDIKAPELKKLVLQRTHGLKQIHLAEADRILDSLEKIVRHSQKIFRNKWSFVDAFMFLSRLNSINEIRARSIARQFQHIEELRREHYKKPDVLLDASCRVPNKRLLYHYILSYKTGGALETSIQARADYLKASISV
ncbi:MAG: hypothetical protein WCK77_11925 [Verrucomicrobiota bacterium]